MARTDLMVVWVMELVGGGWWVADVVHRELSAREVICISGRYFTDG